MEFHDFCALLKSSRALTSNDTVPGLLHFAQLHVDVAVKFDAEYAEVDAIPSLVKLPFKTILVRLGCELFALCHDMGDEIMALCFVPDGKAMRFYPVGLRPGGVRVAEWPDYKQDVPSAHLAGVEVAQFLTLLNAPGQKFVTHEPSKKLNAKRAEKGRLPLMVYKTLVVTKPSVPQVQTSGVAHASPRLHERRGHFRRIDESRTVWIRPCLVGDKNRGVVLKDYEIVSGTVH